MIIIEECTKQELLELPKDDLVDMLMESNRLLNMFAPAYSMQDVKKEGERMKASGDIEEYETPFGTLSVIKSKALDDNEVMVNGKLHWLPFESKD